MEETSHYGRSLADFRTARSGAGVRRQALVVTVGASETVGFAKVYFVGPREQTVSDRAGNFMPGVLDINMSSAALVINFPLLPSGLCARFQCGTSPPPQLGYPPGYGCWCADQSDFTQDDQSNPAALPGAVAGVSITEVNSLLPLLIVLAILCIVASLRLAWAAYWWNQEVKKVRALEETLEKLEGLLAVISAAHDDDHGVDAEACKVLLDAIRQSYQQKRPLQQVAAELLENHKESDLSQVDMGMVVVEDRKHVQLAKCWPSLLYAAYETHLLRSGKRAEHDREALEGLHALLHEASDPPLKLGFDGGGGIRLRPPVLLPRGDDPLANAPPVPRPIVDRERLPNIVRTTAEKIEIDAKREGTGAMRQMLEEYCILPVTVAGALMAEYALRNTGAPPATEKQQVDLLTILNLDRVLAEQPWGIRVRFARIEPTRNIVLDCLTVRA